MRESRSLGSVRGDRGNSVPYRYRLSHYVGGLFRCPSYVGWIARVFAGSSGVFIAWASVLTSERSFSRSGTGRQRRPRTYAKSHFAGAPSRLVLVGQPATITWIGAQLPTSFDQNPFRGIYLGTSGATAVIYEQADPPRLLRIPASDITMTLNPTGPTCKEAH